MAPDDRLPRAWRRTSSLLVHCSIQLAFLPRSFTFNGDVVLPTVVQTRDRCGKRSLFNARLRLHTLQHLMEQKAQLREIAPTVARDFQFHRQHAVRVETIVRLE